MTTNEEAQASETNWFEIVCNAVKRNIGFCAFGLLGFICIFLLEKAAISRNITAPSWELVQNIQDSSQNVLVVEVPSEDAVGLRLDYIFLGTLISLLLIVFILDVFRNSRYQKWIFAFVIFGWVSTIVTFFTNKDEEISQVRYKKNLAEVYKALEKAPPDKKFVYKQIVYDGKILRAILEQERSKK